MFVAPVLFVLHAGLSGLSMVALNLLDVRAIGPNGFIDFLLMNVPLGIQKTSWPMYILVGLVFFALYYVIFKFVITKFNLKTIGREDENEEARLYTKKDYEEKVKSKAASIEAEDGIVGEVIVNALGGKDNIVSVDNCYTRLRVIVKDSDLVNQQVLTQETNANGVVINKENVHVVYGLSVNKMRSAVDNYLANH